MIGPFFNPDQRSAAIAHFDETGHVGLADSYSADIADAAASQAYTLLARGRMNRGPEHNAYYLSGMPQPTQQPELRTVVDAIQEAASLLGRDLRTDEPNTRIRALLLEMGRNVTGDLHIDQKVRQAVGITTLRGMSDLWFPNGSNDGVTYTLEPGAVVVHDAERELPHRGSNGPEAERTGLTLIRQLA